LPWFLAIVAGAVGIGLALRFGGSGPSESPEEGEGSDVRTAQVATAAVPDPVAQAPVSSFSLVADAGSSVPKIPSRESHKPRKNKPSARETPVERNVPDVGKTPNSSADQDQGTSSSGVVLIETGGRHADKEIHNAPDFNPKAFDGVAYLPKARALAKRIYPDAILTEFDVYGVAANGRSNLALANFEASYYFLSKKHATRTLPIGAEDERPCWIHVDVDKRGVTAGIVDSDDCRGHARPNPRCSMREIWDRSHALGNPAEKAKAVAHISYLSDSWFFDIAALRVTGSIDDDC